jgi:hypothetical protein
LNDENFIMHVIRQMKRFATVATPVVPHLFPFDMLESGGVSVGLIAATLWAILVR